VEGNRVKPLAIDLFSGLGGWAEGLEAAGWDVIRVDIEDMFAATGSPKPPGCLLMLQDVLTFHGSQAKHASLIVASPPCQEYSYMAMPWSRAKAKAAAIRADETGAALERLNRLFNACFRIQREASEAAGRYIPMVVENVRGATPWVGRAAWNFGSYYLWGDVPALMPVTIKAVKVPGFRFDGSGGSFQTASVNEHVKVPALQSGRRPAPGLGARFTSRDCGIEADRGLKHGGDWFSDPSSPSSPSSPSRQGGQVRRKVPDEGRKGAGAGAEWFDQNLCVKSSNSPARKAASAQIAKIPLVLSTHIGRVFKPSVLELSRRAPGAEGA
jgi:hypothetical protein